MKKKRKNPVYIPNQPGIKIWRGIEETPKETHVELNKQQKIQYELAKKGKI